MSVYFQQKLPTSSSYLVIPRFDIFSRIIRTFFIYNGTVLMLIFPSWPFCLQYFCLVSSSRTEYFCKYKKQKGNMVMVTLGHRIPDVRPPSGVTTISLRRTECLSLKVLKKIFHRHFIRNYVHSILPWDSHIGYPSALWLDPTCSKEMQKTYSVVMDTCGIHLKIVECVMFCKKSSTAQKILFI